MSSPAEYQYAGSSEIPSLVPNGRRHGYPWADGHSMNVGLLPTNSVIPTRVGTRGAVTPIQLSVPAAPPAVAISRTASARPARAASRQLAPPPVRRASRLAQRLVGGDLEATRGLPAEFRDDRITIAQPAGHVDREQRVGRVRPRRQRVPRGTQLRTGRSTRVSPRRHRIRARAVYRKPDPLRRIVGRILRKTVGAEAIQRG